MNRISRKNSLRQQIRIGGSAATIVCALGVSSVAYAYDPIRPLGQVTGLTELQQRTGDAVQGVCGQFIANGGVDAAAPDAAQQSVLFDKCGEMVHTGNVLNGGDPDDPDNHKALGISAEQLGSALQNLTAEEIAAAGSLATESVSRQTSVVGRRLASLLSQVSSLQVSSANMQGPRALVFAGDLQQLQLKGGGGAAAADSDPLSSPFGFYFSGLGAFAEKSSTEKEDGFESSTAGLSLGVDYLVNDGFLAGLNLGFTSSTTDFDNSVDVSGGDLDSTQINLSTYGMWFNDMGYLDVIAGFGSGSYDMNRRVVIDSSENLTDANGDPNDGANDIVTADTDSTTFRVGVGGGMEIRSGALAFAPYGRLSYLSVDLDAYDEQGASALKLHVNSQSIDSLTGGVGFRLVGTYSGSKAIVSPQFNVELVHEFLDDSRQIVSSYIHDPRNNPLIVVTDNPDRTYYSMGFGVSAVLQSGTQLFTEVRSLMDLDNLSEISATAGVRFEF